MQRVFRGSRGSYTFSVEEPFKYGRICVLFRALGDDGEEYCVKIFRDNPKVKGKTIEQGEFLRELAAQEKLKHPHILPLLDYGTAEDTSGPAFLVYPLCAGGNLRERMAGRSFMPRDEALVILNSIASAIDHAHAAGFLHGDIKPENILFNSHGGGALLADFGMSQYLVFDTPSFRDSSTEDERAFKGGGSLIYLSPEQLEEGVQSTLSDIYSFAQVAYEMVVGIYPFYSRRTLYRQMRAKVSGEIDNPSEVNPTLSEGVSEVLLRALSAEPRSRPKTATSFCQMLRDEKTGLPPLSDPHRGEVKRQLASGIEGRVDSSVTSDSVVVSRREYGDRASVVADPPPKRTLVARWEMLSDREKISIVGALVAAAAGVVTALIRLLPDLFG